MQTNTEKNKAIRRLKPESFATTPKRRRRGWLLVETLVTISILVMLAAAVTVTAFSAGRGNRMLWARQQAAAAVEAQLDCLTVSGVALPAEEFARLWPNFEAAIEILPGAGPTEGLERIEVTVTGRAITKTISVTGRRYIPRRER